MCLSVTVHAVAKPAANTQEIDTSQTDILVRVGAVIDALRMKENLTHLQLSVRADYSRSYVTNIINGKKRLNSDVLGRFARALNTDVQTLLGKDPAELLGKKNMSGGPDSVPRINSSGGYRVQNTFAGPVAQRLDAVFKTMDDDRAYSLMRKCLDLIDAEAGAQRRPTKADAAK